MAYEDADVPPKLRDEALLARDVMLEALADVDDELMEKYLRGAEIVPSDITAALRRATLRLKAVPVLLGAALRNKGIQFLLDAIVDYLPAPTDLPPVRGINPETGEPAERAASESAPASAMAFKIVTDPYVGQLSYLRVYSGKLAAGDHVVNATRGTRERIGRLLRMHANKREEVKEIGAGDIGAAVGLRTARTGDTLADASAPIVLETMVFPQPVIGVAIEPATRDDEDRLAFALEKLAKEDPSFRVSTDPDSAQTIISGMGELHLEVLVDRLAREYKVNARIGTPQVAYRETVAGRARVERRHVKQTGGRGQYGHVVLDIEPLPRGTGFRFAADVHGGSVPREFFPAVEAGIREAMDRGVLAGFPVIDVRVTLIDGSFHQVDSSEIAFKIAGSLAFRDGARDAGLELLEPVMEVEVVTPEEFVGEVMGDLSARRGKITGIETRLGVQVIAGLVPLATMFGYATDLRSRTQGRANYSMQFSQYAQVPHGIRDEVVAKVTGA
jgi:elongation factor G